MAFTAPAVTQEFGLSGTELGRLLSAGLIGMAVGALVLGPLADRFGRLKLLFFALLIDMGGLFMSATAGSPEQLALWRFVTGLGVGGILATVTVIVSEYSNKKNRGLAIGLYTAGYGLGATLGGLATAQLIPAFGWHSVFVLGGILTLISIAVVLVFVPESVDFLRARRPNRYQASFERIKRLLKIDEPVKLGAPPSGGATSGGFQAVLNKRFRKNMLLLWAAFFLVMFAFYFANAWTPSLLVESGLSEQQAITGGIMLSIGGMFGAIAYGAVTRKLEARKTFALFSVLGGAMLIAFIFTTNILLIAFASGVLVGALIQGCMAGMYTLAPQVYSPQIRNAGVGFGIGIGRAGAILAPLLVGLFLDLGMTPTHLYIGAGLVIAAAALMVLPIQPYLDAEETEETTEQSQRRSSGGLLGVSETTT